MNEQITITAGGRNLSFVGPIQSYVDGFRNWNADAGSVAQATTKLSPGAVCVDVGANIGFMALSLAAQRPDCHIIAIEPVPANVESLRINIAANGLKNVEVVHAAVSDRPGMVSMTSEGPWSSVNDRGEVSVRCITLDEFADRGVEFVKIDVEGYEPHALAGARALLKTAKPIVHMEFNLWWFLVRHYDPLVFTDAIWSASEIIGMFHNENLLPPPLNGSTFLYENIAHHAGVTDLLFRPHSAFPGFDELTKVQGKLRFG